MAYLPEDYNKGQSNGQGAGPSTGGGSQAGAGATGQPAQNQQEPIQLSSGTASSSSQQAAPSQQNQNQQSNQTQTQTQGPKGSGMGDATKNLRQYVDQNKNVQLAQNIGKNLQGQATQVSQGIKQSGQKFQQQIAPEQQRLSAAPGVVNTALNPTTSGYFAGTQTLAPQKATVTQTQTNQAATDYYGNQLKNLDQSKQQEYQTKYNSYFSPQTSTQEGQQTQTPAVNDQLQKDYQAYKLNQLQTNNADQYKQYQQAITPEGNKAGEQQYYQQAFAKFGALNPKSQWDAANQQYTPEAIQAQANTSKQQIEDQYRQAYSAATNDVQFQAAQDQYQNAINSLNNQTNQKLASADTDKTSAQQAILQQYGINQFDPNAYQNALLTHLDINPLTQDNAQLEAQNMLASQYGLTSFNPTDYQTTQDKALADTQNKAMGEIQATPEEIAAGQGSTPAERLAYFQKLREGAVQQFNVQDSADLQNKVQALQTQADLGKTEAGRYQLLQNTFNNPEYTTGQQRLDQLLLQRQGGQQDILKNLQQNLAKPAEKQYSDLMAGAQQANTNLSQQATGIKNNIWQQLIGSEKPTTDSSGQLITQSGGLIPNLEAQINSEVTAAGTKASSDAQALKDKIAAGSDITAADLKNFLPAGTSDDDVKKALDYYNESRPDTLQNKIVNKQSLNDKDLDTLAKLFPDQNFTKDQLKRAWDTNAGGFADKVAMQFAQNNMAGAQERTGDWKMDMSKYLNTPDTSKLNAANVASADEYARYAALEALAGQNPNFINPTNISQAGTGNANAGTFDISGLISKGNEVFNPATYGNMQHVSAPTVQGSNLASDVAMGLGAGVGGVVGAPLAAAQFLSKSVGVDVPVVSSIAEGISGSIANLGRVVTGGRVICTELYEQGRLSQSVWKYEVGYGKYLLKYDPYVIPGYHFWAIPLVRLMKKSKIVTKVVEICAQPWINLNIRHNTVFGKVYMNLALGICRAIGKSLELFKGVK